MKQILKYHILLSYSVLFILFRSNTYAAGTETDSAEGLLESTEQMIEQLLKQIVRQAEASSEPSQPIIYSAPSGSNAVIIKKAIAAVKYRLKDPYSARFRNVFVGKDQHKTVYGEVNAKNGFGGYTGYSSFVYVIANGKPEVIFLDN